MTELSNNTKMYYFVDESGDPNFLGRGKTNLLEKGLASKYFMVGYLELSDPQELHRRFQAIREEVIADDFLNAIPSVKHSVKCFHANKDCREVQERVFKALKETEFNFHAVVMEKRIDQFITRFHGKQSVYYAYLVERLMENRLHLYPKIDIYFSKMGAITNEENMWAALDRSKERFLQKWKKESNGTIRIFMQQPSHIAGLQAVDYVLWGIHRVYNHQDFRYYLFWGTRYIWFMTLISLRLIMAPIIHKKSHLAQKDSSLIKKSPIGSQAAKSPHEARGLLLLTRDSTVIIQSPIRIVNSAKMPPQAPNPCIG